jgi:hypothetical protein
VLVFAWIQALKGEMTVSFALRNTVHNWFIPCWLLTKFLRPGWSPYVILAWFAYQPIMINFTFRNFFTGVMELEDFRTEEHYLLVNLSFMYLFNYNKFKMTLLLVPPLLLLGYYFQLQAQAVMMYDPFSGEKLDDELKQQDFINSRMINMFGQLVCYLLHHYFVQRDLIETRIDREIVSRQ